MHRQPWTILDHASSTMDYALSCIINHGLCLIMHGQPWTILDHASQPWTMFGHAWSAVDYA